MKQLLYIIVLAALPVFSFNNVLAQNGKNFYYYNGKITKTIETKEGNVDVPLGVNVTVIYNDFFKNYIVKYTDSQGLPSEIIFEYAGKKMFESVTNHGSIYGVLRDYLSSSDVAVSGTLLLMKMDDEFINDDNNNKSFEAFERLQNKDVKGYWIYGCVKSKK